VAGADLAEVGVAATKPARIYGSLAAATCALLGGTAAEPVRAQEDPSWVFDSALLYYGEDNDRVQDMSLSVLARRDFIDDRYLTLGLTADVLTGASPNGALPQSVPQTFTAPSGNKAYNIAAGELPIDDTFHDTRVALSVDWEQPLGRLYRINLGGSFSKEFDYLHTGLSAKLARDFNNRNTTLSGGLALSHDSVSPVGGAPSAFMPMPGASGRGEDREDGEGGGRGSRSKDLLDVVFGVSQVVSRNFLVQFNYSYSDSSGYLSDPYKILSVVDGVTGDAIPQVATPGLIGPSHVYLFENRPDSRVKHSLYSQAKYFLNGKVLDFSYRYMTDDWDIDSHTLEARFRWPLGGGYLEPHVRLYSQTAADFYRLSLVDGEALPQFASADPRLGEFDAFTVGAKYGWKTRHGNDMHLRLELYQQNGKLSRDQLIGNQTERDNFPDLKAVILQFGYSFDL